MDLEATIVERLHKLKQWQLEQQERLLKQQQMQREILTQKQDSVYKVLEISLQELNLDESMQHTNNSNKIEVNSETDDEVLVMVHNESQNKENCAEMLHSNESYTSQDGNNFDNSIFQRQLSNEKLLKKSMPISDTKIIESSTILSPKHKKEIEQFIIDGVIPLPCNRTSISNICIDDIPVPSPKKDFHTLLEERLKDCENVPYERPNNNSAYKVKRPFLRKGEGLSRFKSNQETQLPKIRNRSRSASFSAGIQSDSKHSKNKTKSNNIKQTSKNVQLTKNTRCTNSSQKHLCLKNVPLPKKKIRSKSESNTSCIRSDNRINKVGNNVELNTSDFHSRTQKEMEEVRIFELLEEKAENSSFCSTSSTVVAFLQQSTPFKKKRGCINPDNHKVNIKQHTSPIIKNLKDLPVQKPNAYICTTTNKSDNSYCDLKPLVNQNELHSSLMKHNMHKSINPLQNGKENNKIDRSINGHAPLKNQVQSTHNVQNFYDIPNVEGDVDVSLHVRFSEYNEYKTIGLTDTSTISTESVTIQNFCDENVWNDDRSTPEMSDTETIRIPFEVSQSSAMMQDKTQNNNLKFALEQCNIQELNYKVKNIGSMKQKDDFNYNKDIHQHVYHNNDSEFSDTTDQFLDNDNEQSILNEHNTKNVTSQGTNNSHNTEELEKCIEKHNSRKIENCVDSYNNVSIIEDQKIEENLQKMNETIFKSELLKNRLLELEQEINIFRKENTALSIQRKKLQEDQRSLHKEYAEKEKYFEDNKKQAEDRLQEERKKLVREKTALENRMRDAQEKAQQSKIERQEMQNLKQELEKLRDEIHLKESRWNAAQSRHKCQVRILKMENSKLKQEIEKLQNSKKGNIRYKGKSGTFSNTKSIHQINKQLNMQFKESKKDNNSLSDDSDHKLVKSMMNNITDTIDTQNVKQDEYNCNSNKNVMNENVEKCRTSMENVKKRNLYENLIKEATSDLTDIQEQPCTSENLNESMPDLSNELKKLSRTINCIEDDSKKSSTDTNVALFTDHISPNNNVQIHVQNENVHLISPTKVSHENHDQKLMPTPSDKISSSAYMKTVPSSCQSNSNIDKQGIRQIQHPDGRVEYWYPNGNVKKIFPDQGLTKLIYYNGDVRETNKNGEVKYFYASTRTWHITMPDGLEILEFADGQVERRSHSGMIEVSFPDGSIRVLESNGTENWTLPNGTLIQTFTNGEKILTLPNGQREIHTKDHKRREYPDGTVKFIYPDGTQETQYSNGRLRLKDKDGNLLRDTYQ
ncbi:uncharacterized protein MAL13P1.304 [Colletes gigas]|uniref:uncharacterized protein MAL13P1.304 n=1 Tax=Colletes gigas TaxID=935657 RepID=UPI001C9AE8C0|nr:uncharacterized protein MAL13P1.304 [Colletes gigas]